MNECLQKKVRGYTMSVNFIDYDGKYPALCSGILIYEHNGIIYNVQYALISGGYCTCNEDGNEQMKENEWKLYRDHFQNLNDDEFSYLVEQVNENVDYGCCGGCL